MNENNVYDVYHFENNQNMVEVLDKNDNRLGTLGQLMFEGRPVTTGVVTDIKVPGVYAIKGVSGLPSGLVTGTERMLVVDSIGPVSTPTLRTYSIIDLNGSIYHRTVSSSGTSEWSSGGTNLQNIVNRISSDIGSVAALKTSHKGTLVGAVNELRALQVQQGSLISGQGQSIGNHTHDDRYVRKDVESDLSTNLNILYGNGIKSKALMGGQKNSVVTIDGAGGLTLGATGTTMNLLGRGDFKYNGSTVWTQANQGSGSGLDADRLDGVEGTGYARKDDNNIMTKNQTLRGGGITFEATSFLNTPGLRTSFSSNGLVVNNTGNQSVFEIHKDSGIHSNGLSLKPFTGASPANAKVTLKQSTPDSGVSMEVLTSSGDLQFRNNRNGVAVGGIRKADDVFSFNKAVKINGKMVYVQDTQPTGNNHPVGSVWISQD